MKEHLKELIEAYTKLTAAKEEMQYKINGIETTIKVRLVEIQECITSQIQDKKKNHSIKKSRN